MPAVRALSFWIYRRWCPERAPSALAKPLGDARDACGCFFSSVTQDLCCRCAVQPLLALNHVCRLFLPPAVIAVPGFFGSTRK